MLGHYTNYIKSTCTKLFLTVLDVLTPNSCPACHQFIRHPKIFCASCMNNIQPIAPTILELFPGIYIPVHAVTYQENLTVRSLVQAQKYCNFARVQLARLMWSATLLPYLPCDYVVPLNTYSSPRLTISYKIAQLLASYKKVPFVSSGIQLSGINNKPLYENKHIILVSDTMVEQTLLCKLVSELIQYVPASITIVVAYS